MSAGLGERSTTSVHRMDRVLILEDEITLRNSLCRVLRQNKELAISETGSLRDALRLLDEQPNLIVSDLDLPDGSGLDLLQELAFRGLHVPVIFITAYLSRFQAQLPQSSNIDVLEKPFAQDDFARLIRRRLDRDSSSPPSSAFSVADYLQLAGLARRDVCLTISARDGTRGKIIVQDGQTAWAEDQLGEGLEAFRRLAFLPQAEVICRPSDERVLASNVQGSLEQLLLDAARQLDESGRRSDPVIEIAPSSRPNLAGRGDDGRAQPPTPPRPVQKEKQVNPSKPLKPATGLDKLVSPSVRGVARAERDGSVLEYSGEMDAETSCAVATVAARQVEELAAELGLGDVMSWHASLGKSSWYVVNSHDYVLVAVGGPNKNPTATLSKVEEGCGRRP
jgi:DNA-binding response OmpR family regulator